MDEILVGGRRFYSYRIINVHVAVLVAAINVSTGTSGFVLPVFDHAFRWAGAVA